MRLEPIYLVEPEPGTESRRGFLGLCVAFTAGAGVGGLTAWLTGWGAAGSARTDRTPDAQDQNPRVGWARRLARDETPIEELYKNYQAFLFTLEVEAPGDPLLRAGAARLAYEVIENGTLADRSMVARMLIATISNLPASRELDLQRLLPLLERIR